MHKTVVMEETIVIPRNEYKFLKELYKTVKRQQFLFRIEESEKKLKANKTTKVAIDKFIESI